MESVSSTINTTNTPAIAKNGTLRQDEKAPQDGFTFTMQSEAPVKPVFTTTVSSSQPDLMGLTMSIMGSSIASTVPGSPLFGSIGGTIAKWLISTEEESRLGQMISDHIETTLPISHDPMLNARVRSIGNRIATNSSRKDIQYQFKVIDDDTINAFACPGGNVYVHRGLLDRFNDDKELAFIMGHEVGHVEHRDSIDKLGAQFVRQIIQTALGLTSGRLDDMVGAATGMLYDNALSRKAEYKADERGAEHLLLLGINPKIGADALRRLESAGKQNPNLLEKLFSTHPPTEGRAQKIEQYAAGRGF